MTLATSARNTWLAVLIERSLGSTASIAPMNCAGSHSIMPGVWRFHASSNRSCSKKVSLASRISTLDRGLCCAK